MARAATGKLHTGRSRNDQVATDVRLWLKDEITVLQSAPFSTSTSTSTGIGTGTSGSTHPLHARTCSERHRIPILPPQHTHESRAGSASERSRHAEL